MPPREERRPRSRAQRALDAIDELLRGLGIDPEAPARQEPRKGRS